MDFHEAFNIVGLCVQKEYAFILMECGLAHRQDLQVDFASLVREVLVDGVLSDEVIHDFAIGRMTEQVAEAKNEIIQIGLTGLFDR